MRSLPLILCLLVCFGLPGQTSRTLPPLKKRATPQAVIDEHLDALNRCDWTRLMAQYPPEVEIFLPNGQTVRGRQAVGELFAAVVKPFKDGGVCGVKFESEHAFVVGNTVNVQWRVTGGALAEPYRGADAYVTKGGLMWAQVSTFERDKLKAK